MTFTENLYLKRQLKQLQEENLKLRNFISESIVPEKHPKMWPGDTEGYDVSYPGKPWRPIGSHPSIHMPRENLGDLHPENPLSVDDADTGPTDHPGQEPRVSYGKMPDPNDPLVTSQEKKRREMTGLIKRYPPIKKPTLDDILASGGPPPRAGAERPTKPFLSEADILGGGIVDAFMRSTKPGSTKNLPKAEQGTPSASDIMGGEIVDKFTGSTKPLNKMTQEEAFKLGADHAREHGGVGTPPHYFYNKDFVAGFNSVK